MTSEELAARVDEIMKRCRSRILNIGKEQYEKETSLGIIQEFEMRSIEQLGEDTLEEIEDAINHLCMLHIRVRRLNEQAHRYAQG